MHTQAIGDNSLTIAPIARHVSGALQNVARMSSREIALLTGKRHPDVKRDIQAMVLALNGDVSSFAHIYLDSMRREQAEYLLDREHTECLLMGYSPFMRMAVLKRLRELEGKQAVIPQTLPDALRLAADLADANNRLKQVVAEQEEIVEAFDRIALAHGSLTLSASAKHLGLGPKQLIAWLKANRWVYRAKENSPWLGYQPRIDAGWLEHKVTVISTTPDGIDLLASQVRVTPKGLSVLAQKLGRA